MIKDRDTTIGYHCPYCGMSILNRINIFSMNGNLVKMKCVCGGSELIVQALKDNKFRLTVPCILCPNSHSFTLSSGALFQKDLFAFTCKFTAINICFIGRSNQVFEAMKTNEEELMKTFAAYEEDYDGEYEDYEDFDDDEFDLFEDDDYGDFADDDFDDIFGDLDDEPLKYEEKEPGFILHKSGEPDKSKIKEMDLDDDNTEAQNSIAMRLQSYQVVGQILESISNLCDRKKIYCQCGKFDGKIVLAGNAVHLECKNCGSYRDIKSVSASDAEYLGGMDELYLDYDE